MPPTRRRTSDLDPLALALLDELRAGQQEDRAALTSAIDGLRSEIRGLREQIPPLRLVYGAAAGAGVAALAMIFFLIALLAESRGIDSRAAAEAAKSVTPTVVGGD
jgi:hypothetical protein